MSAYICNDETFLAIGRYVYEHNKGQESFQFYCPFYGSLGLMTIQGIIDALHRENVRSVDYRYKEANDETPPTFDAETFNRVGLVEFGSFVKMLRCLSYESCECNDHEQSKGAQLITALTCWAVTEDCQEVKQANAWGWSADVPQTGQGSVPLSLLCAKSA